MLDFIKFWWACVRTGWEVGDGIFSFIEEGCAIVAAAIYLFKKHTPEGWQHVEDEIMKWAVIIFAISFVVATVFVAPFLKFQKLQKEKSGLGLNLRIGGFITSDLVGGSTRVQVTVIALNQGVPTTAHGWKLSIKTSQKEFISRHAFGEEKAKGSLDLPWLDARLQEQINTNVEIPGLVSFIFSNTQQSVIDSLADDPSATIYLSVFDAENRECKTDRNIMELAHERREKRPSK